MKYRHSRCTDGKTSSIYLYKKVDLILEFRIESKVVRLVVLRTRYLDRPEPLLPENA